jgi:hypothetical protein
MVVKEKVLLDAFRRFPSGFEPFLGSCSVDG